MPWIIEVKRSKSEIAFVEIRLDGLMGVVNFDAIEMPMNVPVIAVNQKIRAVTNDHLKPFPEQIEKEVIVLVQVSPEVAEIDPNPSFHWRNY
jgi:hypothetical protein